MSITPAVASGDLRDLYRNEAELIRTTAGLRCACESRLVTAALVCALAGAAFLVVTHTSHDPRVATPKREPVPPDSASLPLTSSRLLHS
jgi:hypothetical protein